MRNIQKIIFLISFSLSFGQKSYQIDKTFWIYEKPENYIYREDNFSEVISLGEKFIEENIENACQDSNDGQLLLTIAKNEDSDLNILIASISENSNIVKFTMDGYIDLLSKTLIDGLEKDGTKVDFERDKSQIGSFDFQKLTFNIHYHVKEYKSIMYIGEIDQKEVKFTIIVDNDLDEKLLEDSLIHSSFK